MKLKFRYKGGPGSGHHGHSGRPGKRGGSLPGGGAAAGTEYQRTGSNAAATSAHHGKAVTYVQSYVEDFARRGAGKTVSAKKQVRQAKKFLADIEDNPGVLFDRKYRGLITRAVEAYVTRISRNLPKGSTILRSRIDSAKRLLDYIEENE